MLIAGGWQATCASTTSTSRPPAGVIESKTDANVPLSALRSGCVLVSRDEAIHAAQIFLKCRGHQERLIDSPKALKGTVEIRAAKQALEFLRLFSNRRSCAFAANIGLVEVEMAKTDGWLALREDDFIERCGGSPQARPVEDAASEGVFIVDRCLLSLDSGDLLRVTQRVAPDGGITDLGQTVVLRQASRRIGWCQPGPR